MDGGNESQLYNNQDTSVDYSTTQRVPEHQGEDEVSEIKWTASEFIDHQKSSSWFLALAGIGVLLALIVFLMTRDVFATVIIAFLAVIFGIGAARRPRILDYSLDSEGIAVGNKHSSYDEFKSFAVMNEGPIESIILLPTKRWSPALSIYFAPEDADKIINTLSTFVPFEEREPGLVDSFLHRIHF